MGCGRARPPGGPATVTHSGYRAVGAATIRWDEGELITADHGEAQGEQALAALGGTNLACLEVLKAWRRHRHDHRLLTILTTGPGDVIASDERHGYRTGRPPMAMMRRMQMRRGRGFMASGRAGRAQIGMASMPIGVGSSAGPQSDDEQIEMLARLGGAIPMALPQP